MYVVTINGKEKEVQAEGLTVDKGTIVFYHDTEGTSSKFIVNAGQWESLEVKGDSNAIQINKAKEGGQYGN